MTSPTECRLPNDDNWLSAFRKTLAGHPVQCDADPGRAGGNWIKQKTQVESGSEFAVAEDNSVLQSRWGREKGGYVRNAP